MADKKKQHYVPRLLLKHFASDESKKTVDIFNVDSFFYKIDCPIRGQSQEDYFYGEDLVVENDLAKIEELVTPILREIISNRFLPKRDSIEYFLIFCFTILQAFRTKKAGDEFNAMANKRWQGVFEQDARFKPLIDKGLELRYKNAASRSLGIAVSLMEHAYDLEAKLIVNKTQQPFILSDNPVILHNQFMESKSHPMGHTGMLSKGLQILLPISPQCMLIYYDKWAYKIGTNKERVVECTLEADIDTLNYLQAVFCNVLLYCDHPVTKPYLEDLCEKVKKSGLRTLPVASQSTNKGIDAMGREYVESHTYLSPRRLNVALSFIRQTKTAKQHVLSDYVVQLRDESLRDSLKRK